MSQFRFPGTVCQGYQQTTSVDKELRLCDVLEINVSADKCHVSLEPRGKNSKLIKLPLKVVIILRVVSL